MGKKQFHTRLDDDTAQWVDEFREESDITQAEAVRRLVRAGQQEYQRDDTATGREPAGGGGVFPSAVASMLAAGVALVFAGEAVAGGWLAAGGGFAALNYVLFRAFGWGAWFREVVGAVRAGFRDVGGARGFASLVVEGARRGRPVENPETPVERAANANVYVPFFFIVFLLLAGGIWVIIEAGILPVLGPPGALLLLAALLATAYAVPGAMLVSAVAMLALASSAPDRAAGASEPDRETEPEGE
jgi:hypothetical protein